MVIVIVSSEKNKRTGRKEQVVSHGVVVETGEVVVLPPVAPEEVGAVFDAQIGEYILRDKAA